MNPNAPSILALLALPAALGTACFLNGGSTGQQADSGVSIDGGQPFTADSPFVYVAKVKDILTGLPPTQQEVDSVVNAPDDASKHAALVGLIDQWMTTPQYTTKMLGFFQRAFQQTQITYEDFSELVPEGVSVAVNSSLLENITESFARTALELVAEGRPLNEAFTTSRFMMTPALMEFYGFLDVKQATDAEQDVDAFAKANPSLTITLEDTTAILVADSINPSSPSYMHWYYPGLSAAFKGTTPCNADIRTYAASADVLHNIMYGAITNGTVGTTSCGQGSVAGNAQLTAPDFTTWKMVSIRPPAPGERTTTFYDANGLRNANELVLNIPRIGFFSTPAFHANWMTNTSNQMRVTMNQAFIVALGSQVDGTDSTVPPSNPPGLDKTHASTPDCLGCHQTLDPSRSILQATYSYGYGQQNTAALQSEPGWFVFRGVVNQNMHTIADLGAQLASHPLFPTAWAQKLCYYANSRACAADDPELQRIVSDFAATNFQWKTLVEDVFSSPITTNAVITATTSELGELVSISRRGHICTLLDARLGLIDSCGLQTQSSNGMPAPGIPAIAAGFPSDGYGRGAPVPVLPAQPTLFYRGGLENVCEDVANEIIDAAKPPAGAKTYSSTTPASVNAAIGDFVNNLMGIVADDPRASVMTGLLTDHYKTALGQPATPSNALKSTFITACLSFTVAGIGM